MRKFILSIVALLPIAVSAANAAVVTFKGDGMDMPTNIANNTPCSPLDICGTALTFATGNIDFTVSASARGIGNQLVVQDINPSNSGLGVYSEAGQGIYSPVIRSLDEIDAAAEESLIFTFSEAVTITDIELNNGSDQDCPIIGPEGGCGSFDLLVDGRSVGSFAAVNMISERFVGTTFEFIPLTDSSFHIASLNVIENPLPAAWLLMATGGFLLSRRKRRQA